MIMTIFGYSCQLDLSTLTKEQTHHLELPLEESRGHLVLLVTLTGSVANPTASPPDDLQDGGEILKSYVSATSRVSSCPHKRIANERCLIGSAEVLLGHEGRGGGAGKGSASRGPHRGRRDW